MELLKDLYTVKDIAALLDLTQDAIRALIKRERIKATKFNGAYIITKQDLEAFLTARGE